MRKTGFIMSKTGCVNKTNGFCKMKIDFQRLKRETNKQTNKHKKHSKYI